jgi:predicted house-cleaning noncanonical NTP pyrophosphatase (MazG superfamily)
MDSVIKTVLDGDWTEMKAYCEKKLAEKTTERINDKKVEVLAKINGVDVEKQKEIMAISKGE